MSSGGQALGGVGGAIIGYITGGPSGAIRGAQIGLTVGGMLDPPKGPNTQGPRLSDLSQQTATYGAPIPRCYGTISTFGNIFWIENNKLKEKATKTESGGKGGGGGGSYTSYSYSATFAVGLCEGPIAGVKRIWIGSNLIYDAGSSNVDSIIASNSAASSFNLHLGDETQSPDSRIQATLGVANTPAYRGLAYIVFKDLALADYNNSLAAATIKVEIIGTGGVYSYEKIDPHILNTSVSDLYSMAMSQPYIDTENQLIYWFIPRAYWPWQDTAPYIMDIYTQPFSNSPKTLINSVVLPYANYDRPSFASLVGDFKGCAVVSSSGLVHLIGIDGIVDKSIPSIYLSGIVATVSTMICVDSVSNTLSYCYRSPTSLTYGTINTVKIINLSTFAYIGQTIVVDREQISAFSVFSGKLYLHTRHVDTSTCKFQTYDVLTATLENSVLTGVSTLFNLIAFDTNKFYVSGNSATYLIDNFLIAAAISGSASVGSYVYITNPLGGSKYADGIYYSTGSCQALGVLPGILRIAKLLISSTKPDIASIIKSETLKNKSIYESDIVTNLLTGTVGGYKLTNISALRTGIEPLQGVWPFDIIQQGYKILFKPRGGSSIATIPASDLACINFGDTMGVSITNSREMDIVLPKKVIVSFLDVDREYDTGQQYAERLSTSSVNIVTQEIAISMNSTDAAEVAENLLYLYWLERYDISFSLPSIYNQLEPGDVITVNADEGTYSLRLIQINYTSTGILECVAKYNNAAIYTPSALGEYGVASDNTLGLAGSTIMVLLDMPLIIDANDIAGFPAAVSGQSATWSGALIYRTDDLGQTWVMLQSFTAPGAVICTTSTSITATRFDLIDSTSVLQAKPYIGELFSVDEASMLNGSNHFAYGADGRWEIIAAKTCTLQADSSYILTNLLRGRFGTEWAASQHVVGDKLVLLDRYTMAFLTTTSASIGMSRTYKGVTAGATLSSASDNVFAYKAVNLKCLSPVWLNGNRHPTTNDWTLTWIRRTRIGGEWRDAVDATLGETIEQYEIEIDTTNVGDLYFGSVKLLSHFDSTISDVLGHTINNTSSMVVSDLSSKYGGKSLYSDGLGSGNINIPASADFTFGTGDFTIELWAAPTIDCPTSYILSNNTSFAAGTWILEPSHASNPGKWCFFAFGIVLTGLPLISSSNSLTGLWQHIAVTRSGNTLRLFVNGVIESTYVTTDTIDIGTTNPIYINPTASRYKGFIDEIRITKGICRYSSNFLVPVKSFPDTAFSVGAGIRVLYSNTQQVSYPADLQMADFGAIQSTLSVRIYQMSSVTGRGYPLTTQITR